MSCRMTPFVRSDGCLLWPALNRSPLRPHLLSFWPTNNSLNTTRKCVLLLDFISITFVDCRPAACKQHRQGGPVLYVYTARGWRANVFSFLFFHVYGVSKNSACRPNGVRWITRWSGWVGEGRTVRATCHRDTNTTTSYSRVQEGSFCADNFAENIYESGWWNWTQLLARLWRHNKHRASAAFAGYHFVKYGG